MHGNVSGLQRVWSRQEHIVEITVSFLRSHRWCDPDRRQGYPGYHPTFATESYRGCAARYQRSSRRSCYHQADAKSTEAVLFNESIAYNIGYGKDGATQAEIEEAAKAARIYDRIQTFPDGESMSRKRQSCMFIESMKYTGWNTVVGERGVRLSGGGGYLCTWCGFTDG